MNRNQKILAASGGVIAVAAAAAGFFVWNAVCAKTAALDGDDIGTDGLRAVQDRASELSRRSVYPCAESVKTINANTAQLDDWCAAARRLAARGDRPVRTETPPQFKAEMVADAKRLAALPGEAEGRLMKPDFAFGPFRPYIVEGKMPSPEELPTLQRRWDDVALVVELLSKAGVSELVDVAFGADAAGRPAAAKGVKPAAKRPQPKPKAKAKAKGDGAAPAPDAKAFPYVFTFTAHPAAFVAAVNALGTNERFIVVDSLSVTRVADAISEALGGADGKKKEPASRGGRGARSARGAAPAAAPAAKDGIVTDPASEAPFRVSLDFTVYDFGLLAESEEGGKEAAK